LPSLSIVGECERRIFGLSPRERLARQAERGGDGLLVADASAVLGDSAVVWLADHPGTLLTSAGGRPLAIFVPVEDKERAERVFSAGGEACQRIGGGGLPEVFNRKLRRRETLFAMSLAEQSPLKVERALFASVYKGVTDLVTKWAWPEPAFWVTRTLARIGIPPNAVTAVGMILTLVAAYCFAIGALAEGLIAAWAMTFLDTVDGKLARVTSTSSWLGNLLDHGTDLIHPPLWWICLAIGVAQADPTGGDMLFAAAGVILVTYLIGRVIEGVFKRKLGFNAYIWQRFDSLFRLILARRNTILLIMTAGLAIGASASAYLACAAWSLFSVGIQLIRFGQAWLARPIRPWLAG
jgi:phosphatidylglycerophosphate synthase